jgi:hypothetical protein
MFELYEANVIRNEYRASANGASALADYCATRLKHSW